ncbi:MAG: nucleotidyltransferase [Betaproteobacteria bacterium HGW-Betaproteobacteria-10]|nr:MAG: nucleotidyltransferase [Betaproteobacteria bacterium HGW-Betaproteobacteria-10]
MTDTIENLLPCRQQAELIAALKDLKHVDAAPELARRIRVFLIDLVSRGFSGYAATRLISAFNDQLTTRIVEIVAARHRLPPVTWCWLALGSEGRREQTFVSDQDNGLIFNASDAREAEALRQLFLPFAQEVNQRLADCGFKLCPGQIMAGNPAWCLSLDEWREQFIDWVRRPEPTALLNASIFFDLQPLFGELELGEKLRTLLLGLTSDTPSFLHLMAANALQAEVPLNFRGEVAAEAGSLLDLKKYGSRIFVDAARIFALASGGRSVNTAERLQDAARAVGLTQEENAAVDAAFSHILRLRLTQQLEDLAANVGERYSLDLSHLHGIDKAILRESLKQARRLQLRLKLNYAL